MPQDTKGLLQAIEVHCQHAKTASQATFQIDGLDSFKNCKVPREKIYAIYPLPLNNFAGVAWDDVTLPVHLQFMFVLAQGAETFHAGGFAFGTIEMSSLLVMSMDPPVAVIGDYRSVSDLFEPADLELKTSGVSTKAESDVESLGKIYIEMLHPQVRQLTGSNWRARWIQTMENYLDLDGPGNAISSVVNLLISMISENPGSRPTMRMVVRCLTWEVSRRTGEELDDWSNQSQDDLHKATNKNGLIPVNNLALDKQASNTETAQFQNITPPFVAPAHQSSGHSANDLSTNGFKSKTLKRSRTAYELGRNGLGGSNSQKVSNVKNKPQTMAQASAKQSTGVNRNFTD